MTQTTLEPVPHPKPVAESGRLDRFRRDSTYLLAGLPVAIVAFTFVVIATSLAASLLVLAVGLPLLVIALQGASGFARVERVRLRALGMPLPEPVRVDARTGGWRGWMDAVRDRRAWLDVLHAVVAFPVTVVTWSMAVTW